MKDKLKCLESVRLILLMGIFLFCLSCATAEHNVNSDLLDQTSGHVFHVGRIKVPCGKNGLYERHQVILLDSAPIEEVRQVLMNAYGLNIAFDEGFSLKSKPISWQGMIPGLGGRCFYKENNTYDENADMINIVYKTTAFGDQFYRVHYEVVVKSSKKNVIKHKGEIDSFTIPFSANPFLDNRSGPIISIAQKLPEALRRDILATGKQKPSGAANAEGAETDLQSGSKPHEYETTNP